MIFVCQQVFASRYSECNPDIATQFRGRTDTVFLLCFATVLLNTDLHHRCVCPKTKMSVDDFIHNLRGWLLKCWTFRAVESVFVCTVSCEVYTEMLEELATDVAVTVDWKFSISWETNRITHLTGFPVSEKMFKPGERMIREKSGINKKGNLFGQWKLPLEQGVC